MGFPNTKTLRTNTHIPVGSKKSINLLLNTGFKFLNVFVGNDLGTRTFVPEPFYQYIDG